MTFAPLARIVIRYGVGYFVGAELAGQLEADPDVINTVALAIAAGVGVATEGAYVLAKRWGWAT